MEIGGLGETLTAVRGEAASGGGGFILAIDFVAGLRRL